MEFDPGDGHGFRPFSPYHSINVSYVEDGYYNIDTTDTAIRVTWEVEGNGYKGYALCLVDSDKAICYQFTYIEKVENFDAERAMNVINSIEYWLED